MVLEGLLSALLFEEAAFSWNVEDESEEECSFMQLLFI